MFVPLIKSKFRLPKLPVSYTTRTDLLDRLEIGAEETKKLTLVTGNAGYGKTTLVSEYVQKSTEKYFWYGLTEHDADLVVFINHFVKGLKLVMPNVINEEFEMLVSSSNYSESTIQNIIGILIENISIEITDPFIIVIDDFQFLRNSDSIIKIFEYFIDFLPENIQLILISRYIPNIKKLSQLKVRQQLVEITTSDLKFSKKQLEAFIPKEVISDLNMSEIEEIYEKTEGWIGIIILLVQIYNTNKSLKTDVFKTSKNNQDVFQYIASEVFEVHDNETKEAMLISALMPKINDELILDINIKGFKEKLDFIKSINLLENISGNDYSYNPIFEDFLKEKAKESIAIETQKDLYYKIGSYYEKKKDFELAIEYYFFAQAYEKAEKTLLCIAQELINNNRIEVLDKLISSFSEEYFNKSANLQIFAGEVKRLWGNYTDAMNHFYNAEEIAIKTNTDSSLAKAYVYESIIHASKGEGKEELIDEALKIFPDNDVQGLAFAYNTKGITYLFGEKIIESLTYFEKALQYYEEAKDSTGQAKVLHNLGFAYSMLGSFEHSKNTYERSVKQAESTGKYPYIMTYNNLAIIHNYLGEFKEARFFAEKALSISQQLQYKRDMSYAYWTLGMISANTEDYLKAEDYFNTSLSIGLELGDRQLQAYSLSGLSEIARLQGKIAKAFDLINEAIRRRDLPLDNQGNIELLVQKTTICIDNNDYDKAKNYIEMYLIEKIEKLKYKYYLTYIYFYLTLIYEKTDPILSKNYAEKTEGLIKENNYHFFLNQQKNLPEIFKHKVENTTFVKEDFIAKEKLRFYCFTEFKAVNENKPITNKEWNGFKTKLALAYLLHHPKGVTKEQLAELLYPDTDITRTAINVILSRVRKALEIEDSKEVTSKYIIFNDGKYFFNFASSYYLDTEEFNYLIKELKDENDENKKISVLRKIISLYSGDFLNEFSGELWVQIEKENYRRKIDSIFEQLFNIYYKNKAFEEIISLAEKELSLDRCNEKAFQRKIKALISIDKKDDALKNYKIMKNMLKAELGVEPSHESLLLYQKICR